MSLISPYLASYKSEINMENKNAKKRKKKEINKLMKMANKAYDIYAQLVENNKVKSPKP